MNLLLGVSGSIAAYKACDLASSAVKLGWNVRVVMSRSATAFVGPLTFEALTGHPVMVEVLSTGHSSDGVSSVDHISWARWADVAVIAPLSANTMAKLATGMSDNALTTTWLALESHVPQVLCPAMNTRMWEHPVTQRNLRWLKELDRYTFVDPITKRLADGETGMGALAEVPDILAALAALAPAGTSE